MKPRRPALRYFGGKWMLAKWIIAHLPPHRIYVEPFGGAGSVLLRKPRAYAEVWNDLDDEVVDYFRILRDPSAAAELRRQLTLTPFAREEFSRAYDLAGDPIERARRLVVRSFMGHGVISWRRDRRCGFRCDNNRAGTTPAHDWANLPAAMEALTLRLQGVVIEKRPALDLIRSHATRADTLIYVDPPYMHETRSSKRAAGDLYNGYRHELSDEDHWDLLASLRECAGGVVLTGYSTPLYEAALPDWTRVEREAWADGARPRTEALWLNPRAAREIGAAT